MTMIHLGMQQAYESLVQDFGSLNSVLFNKRFVIQDSRRCWAGGSRASDFSLGLAFIKLMGVAPSFRKYTKVLASTDGTILYEESYRTIISVVDGDRLNFKTFFTQQGLDNEFIYDIFILCQYQLAIASKLGLNPGHLCNVTGKLTLENTFKAIEATLEPTSEWVSPIPLKEEVDILLSSSGPGHLHMAYDRIRKPDHDLFEALSYIPNHHKWSQTALKAMHYHITRKA